MAIDIQRPVLKGAKALVCGIANEHSIAYGCAKAFRELGADASLRAIVLGGHGKAFCAGGDLNWMRAMADYSWQQNRADAQALADMLWTIYTCPLPVVGRVHGDCYAGGVGLASVCDVLVAAEGMHFCLSEAKLGLLPATIGPYVVRALGEQASRRYFITAERFGAAEAHRLGFVHELASADALDQRVDAIVQALLANGPAAVKASKQLVRDLAGAPLTPELRADTARRIADGAPLVARWHKKFIRRLTDPRPLTPEEHDEGFACFDTEDFRIGYRAFLDKKKPEFKGR